MAHQLRLTTLAVNTLADGGTPGFSALFNSGYLRIYDGTQPTTADDAITTQVLLAELRWNSTAFGAASVGTITANAITPDTNAPASGTHAWFRALKSDGTTKILDGSSGTSNTDIILPVATINAGQTVSITTLTITVPKS